MSDLLEQLYFGELSPFESWAKQKDEETMWFRQQLLRGEEQLRALLDEEADQRSRPIRNWKRKPGFALSQELHPGLSAGHGPGPGSLLHPRREIAASDRRPVGGPLLQQAEPAPLLHAVGVRSSP